MSGLDVLAEASSSHGYRQPYGVPRTAAPERPGDGQVAGEAPVQRLTCECREEKRRCHREHAVRVYPDQHQGGNRIEPAGLPVALPLEEREYHGVEEDEREDLRFEDRAAGGPQQHDHQNEPCQWIGGQTALAGIVPEHGHRRQHAHVTEDEQAGEAKVGPQPIEEELAQPGAVDHVVGGGSPRVHRMIGNQGMAREHLLRVRHVPEKVAVEDGLGEADGDHGKQAKREAGRGPPFHCGGSTVNSTGRPFASSDCAAASNCRTTRSPEAPSLRGVFPSAMHWAK